MKELPVCIVATTIGEGKRFAEDVGIENYIVHTNMTVSKMEGRRFREVVVTRHMLSNIIDTLGMTLTAFNLGDRQMRRSPQMY